ncbi:hypothetical protein EVAR_89899_1 [Eumeta japonica]|uniref:Reverse transcriptase domain-containing protein n=1 Tax=Eumeta variegata TaxID=151549 RepID=A0A4C1YX36_EUMVA|nr:hypothetical protein EVAR_89899_1 [Eumeta japonica]
MNDFQGLVMEPEVKPKHSIIEQLILAVFGLIGIFFKCTLGFQDLTIDPDDVATNATTYELDSLPKITQVALSEIAVRNSKDVEEAVNTLKRRLHKLWTLTCCPRLKTKLNELGRKLAVAVRDHGGAAWEETIDYASKTPSRGEDLRACSVEEIESFSLLTEGAVWIPYRSFDHAAARTGATPTYQVSEMYCERYTIAVFLDIDKAFDRMWHDGLLHKLLKTGLPPALKKYLPPRAHFLRSIQGCAIRLPPDSSRSPTWQLFEAYSQRS